MKLNSFNYKIEYLSVKALFTLTILFFAVSVSAQLPTNLKNINVDSLSDEQIRGYITQSESTGLSEAELEKLAIQRGLSSSELDKLKQRVTIIKEANKPKTKLQDDIKEVQSTPKEEKLKSAPIDSKTPIDSNTIYGHQWFSYNNIQFFEKATDVKAPDNYIISIGDELTVSVFGISYYNEALKVDSRGAINPKGIGIGPINLKGQEFGKAKQLIKSKFSQYFDMANNEFAVTLSYARVINVNIVGEVVNPGSYKIPAVNSAFNALKVAGGVNEIGSVRNIQVKRNGKLIKTLDVYEFLNNPNSKLDFYLEDNDYIFVGSSTKVVNITGEVKRSMRYEVTAKETLQDLISYAGGLTSQAYTKLIRVTRTSDDGTQVKIISVSLDSLNKNKKQFLLQDGDQIEVGSKSNELKAFVEIQGSVNFPGKFEYIEGERISDLVKKANGTRFESLLERAYLIRLRPDLTKEYVAINLKQIIANPKSDFDLTLKKGDLIRIASNKDFSDVLKVEALGAFRIPSSIEYSKGMTLGDLMFIAGGLKMEADILHLEISRISFFTDEYKPGESSRVLIKVIQVGKDIRISDDQMAMPLSPYDQVFARVVPDFEYQQNFSLTGEVKYPGLYALESKEERLDAIINRAGGLNRFAFPEGATLYRPDLPGGYIVMNLKDALKNKDSKYNYVIKAGDVINVPRVIDFVAIRGDVEYLQVVDQEQVNAPFVKGKRADYYIKEFANGYTKTALKKKTYVVDNNAKVSRTKNYLLFKVYPKVKKGATIYAVTKPEKRKKSEPSKPIDWNKAISDLTVKLTGIVTLMILLQSLN